MDQSNINLAHIYPQTKTYQTSTIVQYFNELAFKNFYGHESKTNVFV